MAKLQTFETGKLSSVVSLLCQKLGRPVCSKDLKAYFSKHPDEIPQLQQRLGQILIKAARPHRRGDNPLKKIGLIGNQAYYAVGVGNWAASINAHKVQLRIEKVVLWRLPETLTCLLGTKFEAAARNALAGFVKEWSATDFPPLAEQVAEARRIASPKFQLHLPKDLIGRKEAKALLLKLVAKHDGKLRAQHFNPDRPLAFLCWPQSSIFKEQPELTYSKSQIQAFTSWKSGFEGREKLYLSFYDPTILSPDNGKA
jgi:hypothetical protein